MDPSFRIRRGWQAVDRSGESIGTVEEIGGTYFVVSRGSLSGSDVYVPIARVSTIDGTEGVVGVDVDMDRIGDLGWDHNPHVPSRLPGPAAPADDDAAAPTIVPRSGGAS